MCQRACPPQIAEWLSVYVRETLSASSRAERFVNAVKARSKKVTTEKENLYENDGWLMRIYKQFTTTHKDVKFMFTDRRGCHEQSKGLCNKKRHKQVFLLLSKVYI